MPPDEKSEPTAEQGALQGVISTREERIVHLKKLQADATPDEKGFFQSAIQLCELKISEARKRLKKS